MNSQYKKGVLELCVLSLLRGADGLVTTYLQEESGGPPRKYYKLTQLGEDVYSMDRAEYLRFAEAVRGLLKEDDEDEEK